MLVIPLQSVPSQTITATLNNQNTTIDVITKSTGLFVNVYVNSVLIIGGVQAENEVKIVRDAYLGFIGDLAFVDTQGADNPVYTGLGTRFILVYFTPDEL